MRYIIGLNPLIPLPYFTIAQKLFSDVSDGYLLSETALPHITLTQIELEEKKDIKALWDTIKEYKIQSFVPKLIGMSFIKGLHQHKGFYWAQIAVEREPILMEMHYQILAALEKHRLTSIIDSGDIYKPHITLARIKLLSPISLWPENILESSVFKLTLGKSDQNGRYIEKLYESL